MAGDSSGSSGRSHFSSSRYDDRATRRFKAERDETRHVLKIISKDAGIAELEWEHRASSCWRPLMVNLVTCYVQLNIELTAIAL
jgi:hypothetical protein